MNETQKQILNRCTLRITNAIQDAIAAEIDKSEIASVMIGLINILIERKEPA